MPVFSTCCDCVTSRKGERQVRYDELTLYEWRQIVPQGIHGRSDTLLSMEARLLVSKSLLPPRLDKRHPHPLPPTSLPVPFPAPPPNRADTSRRTHRGEGWANTTHLGPSPRVENNVGLRGQLLEPLATGLFDLDAYFRSRRRSSQVFDAP